MADKKERHDLDERVALPIDTEAALKALLGVKPDDALADGDDKKPPPPRP